MMCCRMVLLLTVITITSAFPYFQELIPNGDKVTNPCDIDGVKGMPWPGVGHRSDAGSGPRNTFGIDFELNNFVWDDCICRQDSDKDGRTNGEELGDPDCVWTPGQDPESTDFITHPGICDNDNDDTCTGMNFWLDCESFLPFECPAFEQEATKSVELRIEPTEVPPNPSNLMCTAFTFPAEVNNGDYHMIGAETLIGSRDIIHHLIVYGCPDQTAGNASHTYSSTIICGSMVTDFCPEVIYIWGVGLQPDCFDDEYGIRIGLNGFKTVVIEMHWNNPQELIGETDNSGIKLYYTPDLRQYDAESIFIGKLYLELPPYQSMVRQASRCPGECTEVMFSEPVYISQIIPHMHYAGAAMKVTLIRDGMDDQILINQDAYDYNDPKPKKFSPHVMILPGDEILVECFFDTSDRTEFTFWGFATSDEMCIAITQYYPKRADATNCWGYELGDANIGDCGNTYGESELYGCYAILAEDKIGDLVGSAIEWSNGLEQVCDTRGIECKPGCKEYIAEIRKNACFTERIDGWTKNVIIGYLTNLASIYADTYISRSDFQRALSSCDERMGITDDTDDHTDDHDHPGSDGDDDTCVFFPPPVPTTSSAPIITSSVLMILTLLFARMW